MNRLKTLSLGVCLVLGSTLVQAKAYWMVQTLEKALDVYENHAEAWKQLQHNAMTRDFSWDTASLAYVDLYKQLV